MSISHARLWPLCCTRCIPALCKISRCCTFIQHHQFSTGCCEDSSKSLHVTCWNKLWLKLPPWLDISLQRLILCPSQSALPKSPDHPELHRIIVPYFILEITISWCYLELSFAYKLILMNSYKFVKCSRTLILREFFSTINFNLL